MERNHAEVSIQLVAHLVPVENANTNPEDISGPGLVVS
jgi:hypothetical protein